MMFRPHTLLYILLISFFFLFLTACQKNLLIPVELSKNPDSQTFLKLAMNPETNPEQRFAALESLIIQYREAGAQDQLTLLLWRILDMVPEDPYCTYYLMALGEGARELGNLPMARNYWRRILYGYPDLIIRDKSLHLLAMRELAKETEDPQEAIDLYQEMLKRFPQRIDVGRTQYILSKYYEKTGDWNAAYNASRAFLESPETRIPGEPNAQEQIRKSLAFHTSDKSWAVEDLDELISTIKRAIRTRSPWLLKRSQSQEFFFMNWSQNTSDSFTHIPMELGTFLSSSVGYRKDLEIYSNESEAYLRTWGWSYRIQTWYLYFRKIHYPANPEINGRWEWAGIYFGERL